MDKINGHLHLTDILYRLIDYAKYIVLAMLVFALLGAALYKQPAPVGSQEYRADISLYIIDTEKGVLDYSDLQVASNLLYDYVNAFSNLNVQKKVIQKLNLPYNEMQLESMVYVSNPKDTHILQISVYSIDPDEAVKMAEAYAEVASEFIAEKMNTSRMSVWEEAHIASAPLVMKVDTVAGRIRNAVFAGIAGLFLACAMIICITLIDSRVRAPKDLEADTGIPMFGVLTQQEIKDTVVTFSAKRRA